MLCWADASFRPKWTTAQIATGWQKHWKMSTARNIKKLKSGTCTAVWLKNRVVSLEHVWQNRVG
jgi:hypothetical protein